MATTEQTMIMMKAGSRRKAGSDAVAFDFEQVFNRHLKPVYAFIAYRVGNRAAAEDITSQVFEKAWISRSDFDPGRGNISSWLFTIARNCVIDHARRRQNRESTLEFDIDDAGAEDPHRSLELKERRAELARALVNLDEREREVIALKFGGGMSNKDIASVLELTPTNVSTILYRSLDKLNTQLEDGIQND